MGFEDVYLVMLVPACFHGTLEQSTFIVDLLLNTSNPRVFDGTMPSVHYRALSVVAPREIMSTTALRTVEDGVGNDDRSKADCNKPNNASSSTSSSTRKPASSKPLSAHL